jgi:hypothetical protein
VRAKSSFARAFRVGLIRVAGAPLMRGGAGGALSVRRRFGDGDGVGVADMIDFVYIESWMIDCNIYCKCDIVSLLSSMEERRY